MHADQLIAAQQVYATFLLWLLTEHFHRRPEAGDPDKTETRIFFDEAHLLFNDAPKAVLHQIEKLVRLVRSKGVGLFYPTQCLADLPDVVLKPLGTQVLHRMRARTRSRKGN